MKHNNYICHAPYFRNSIAYDQYGIWSDDYCKMVISPGGFFILIFRAVREVVRAKNSPKSPKNTVVLLISVIIHHIIVIYGTLVWNNDISSHFFIFQNFDFLGKRGKNGPKWEKIVCHTPYPKKHTSDDFHLWYICVKW